MLHPGSCYCEACKEGGLGYPAFCDETDESWPNPEVNPLYVPGFYDAADFGKPSKARRFSGAIGQLYKERSGKFREQGYGQAFVPGVVKPAFPSSAMVPCDVPGQVFSLPGFPEVAPSGYVTGAVDPSTGALVGSVVSSPDLTTGIAPTLSYADAQTVTATTGGFTSDDGSAVVPVSPGIPMSYVLAGLAALVLLK